MNDLFIDTLPGDKLVYLAAFGFFLWLSVLSWLLFSFQRRYYRLVKDVSGKDLKDVWMAHLAKVEQTRHSLADLDRVIKDMQKADEQHLQKVSLIRFNPFADTGGNQSFAIALLDKVGCGVVISSLHGREGTRVYAKNVANFGNSDFEFSKEESEVIKYATKS